MLEKSAIVFVMEALIAERCWGVTGASRGRGVGLARGFASRGFAADEFTVTVAEESVAEAGGGLWKPAEGEAIGGRLSVGPVGSWSALKLRFVRRGLLGIGVDIGVLELTEETNLSPTPDQT